MSSSSSSSASGVVTVATTTTATVTGPDFSIKRNDTLPAISSTLRDADGNAVNLSGVGVVVVFKMQLRAAGSVTATVDAEATIVSAPDGMVRYDWIPEDTATAGLYDAEFEVTFSDDSILSFPNDRLLTILITEDVPVDPATGSVLMYLRNLTDDAVVQGTPPFWSDAELLEALEVERRTVQPWREDDSLSAWLSWRYDIARLNPASRLDAGPGFIRFQARFAYRFWAETPAPVVYVNGQEATQAGYDYDLDLMGGTVTFTDFPDGATALSVGDCVTAAFDRYNVYEAAYTLMTVAMGQWASVAGFSTPTITLRRAKLKESLSRIERLRRKGKPLPRTRYSPVA